MWEAYGGGGSEPHTTKDRQAGGGEGGGEGSTPLCKTCHLGATMAVTMTLEEKFPQTPPPQLPTPPSLPPHSSRLILVVH